VKEAIGSTRSAFMRMIDAHVQLLRAELSITGREVGIIVGLGLAAFSLAVLIAILLFVGSFLFIGDWLFGSMGWGIIHGTLLMSAGIGAVAVNLGGGDVRAYALGAIVGVLVTVVLAALLLSNVGNESAEWGRRFIEDNVDSDGLPFGAEWYVTIVGFVVGAVVGAVLALIASWQATLPRPFAVIMTGLGIGGFIGALYASTRYQAADGVLGLAITLGLITWIAVGLALAARAGFDPEARYANLVPRESIAAFTQTKDFLMQQWEKQKHRMMGR
jgi:hypothetical protein